MPAAVTETMARSGPGSAGSGRVSTPMVRGPSRTTVRMVVCSLPLPHNELRPFGFPYRGPVLVEAPRADGVDLAVGVLEVRMLDRGVRPHHLLDLRLGPSMPLGGGLGLRFERMQVLLRQPLEALVDVAHLQFRLEDQAATVGQMRPGPVDDEKVRESRNGDAEVSVRAAPPHLV